jgi:hypothetical protein
MHPTMHHPEQYAPERDLPPRPRSHPLPTTRPDSPPAPSFLIIGLFALRLTYRLISSLDPYPEQHRDLSWLDGLLAQYGSGYDLAVLRGAAKEEYIDVYPRVVGRMKRQRGFPKVFMDANPSPRVFGVRREGEREGGRRRDEEREREEISDGEYYCLERNEWIEANSSQPRDERSSTSSTQPQNGAVLSWSPRKKQSA